MRLEEDVGRPAIRIFIRVIPLLMWFWVVVLYYSDRSSLIRPLARPFCTRFAGSADHIDPRILLAKRHLVVSVVHDLSFRRGTRRNLVCANREDFSLRFEMTGRAVEIVNHFFTHKKTHVATGRRCNTSLINYG